MLYTIAALTGTAALFRSGRKSEEKRSRSDLFIEYCARFAIFCFCSTFIFQYWNHTKNEETIHLDEMLLQDAFRLVPGTEVSMKQAVMDDRTIPYLKWTQNKTKGYLFQSEKLVSDIYGYAGPISLSVAIDTEGRLVDFRISHSMETPVFLEMTKNWQISLPGINLRNTSEVAAVDTVTGATMSSSAIKQTLTTGTNRFLDSIEETANTYDPLPPRRRSGKLPVLAGALLCAIAIRKKLFRKFDPLFLLFTVIIFGLIFRLQFSSRHIVHLILGELPPASFRASFLLYFLPILIIALFGNVYCARLCPVGAAQELMARLAGKYSVSPHKSVMKWARLIKYGFLISLLIAALTDIEDSMTRFDPLTFPFTGLPAALLIGLILMSLFFPRFWCRTFCPTGAFLSVFNRFQILRKFIPKVNHTLCPYSLRDTSERDCICCDRCRNCSKAEAQLLKNEELRNINKRDRVFLAAVFLWILILVSAV